VSLAAHELNPVELVWSNLKRSLASLAKRNLAQLTALVKTRLRRMQYRPSLLEGFLASTRLDLTPFCNPPPLKIVISLGSFVIRLLNPPDQLVRMSVRHRR
jgi:putative transposase